MSKLYGVSIPVTGFVYVEIQADSIEDAKSKALQVELTTDNIEEWDTCEDIVTGNVFRGLLKSIDAEELE